MTTEEKFNAAVNVIRNLPKNGSYQPSNDLMLRFYAYFKQATQGPCTARRPPFYDVVGRAKHSAWESLGNMPKTEAMGKYVEELHSIVETMSYSDNVANFLETSTADLDSISFNDLELVAGDVIERIRSQPNSPLASREASPIRMQHNSKPSNSGVRSHLEESDHTDEEEFTDTFEFPEIRKNVTNCEIPHKAAVGPSSSMGSSSKEHVSRPRTKHSINSTTTFIDSSYEISNAIKSLRSDIEELTTKLNTVDKNSEKAIRQRNNLFYGIPLKIILFFVAWPILANLIMYRFFCRCRN